MAFQNVSVTNILFIFTKLQIETTFPLKRNIITHVVMFQHTEACGGASLIFIKGKHRFGMEA